MQTLLSALRVIKPLIKKKSIATEKCACLLLLLRNKRIAHYILIIDIE